jgi:O-antigen/teichoic acid export membrane protein
MATKDPFRPQSRPPSVRRSLVLSFARNYTNLLFSVGTVMILSRLLTPAQIGVYSVAVATTTVIQMLRDFGVSEYLVQEKELNNAIARSAFTVNLLIAWSLAIIVFFSSPWIAAFYREPGLGLVLEVLSINFVLLPFGSTVNALLTRSMQFGILYKINFGWLVVRAGTTVTLAYLGFGYMSPAWGSVAGMAASVLGCFVWGRAYRIRGFGLTHWRAVTRFGMQQTVSGIVGQLGSYAPDFVIGRTLGFADVGLYSRGQGLINLFSTKIGSAIAAVSFPAYAHRHHKSSDAHRFYLKTLTFVTGIALPFAACAALMAFPIIHIMFGDQWYRAVPILRLLAVAMFFNNLTPQFAKFFTATGRIGVVTGMTVFVQVLRVGILIPAAFYSLEAAAASQIVVAIVSTCIQCGLLKKYAAITLRDLWVALSPSLWLTVVTALVPTVVFVLMPNSGIDLWLSLIFSVVGGGAGWLIAAWMVKHPLWFELVNAMSRVYRWKSLRA